MNRNIALSLFFLMLIAGGAWLFVVRSPQTEVGNGKIHIVASFYPLANIASAVGGDLVAVRTLVPAGTESHDFEPSPRDFIEIGKADILLYNGAGFEPWVKKWNAGESSQSLHIVDMASALTERGDSLLNRSGGADPHFWLDPVIYAHEVEIVRNLLVQVDPLHRDAFIERSARLVEALKVLDDRYQKDLAACPTRDIVVSHDAFRYLAVRYGINVTSIAGISPDEEPAPKDLARIVAMAREKKVKYIFSETVASAKFSELIAREVDVATLVLNPIESLTPNEVQSGDDYVSKMEMNLSNLKKALSCP